MDMLDEKARELGNLFNTSPPLTGPVEYGYYKFDQAIVIWPVEPPHTDFTRPPDMIGGAVYVHDTVTGKTTAWARLAAPHVAELYRKARAAGEV